MIQSRSSLRMGWLHWVSLRDLLHTQEFVELVRADAMMPALKYAQQHLAPHAASHMAELQQVLPPLPACVVAPVLTLLCTGMSSQIACLTPLAGCIVAHGCDKPYSCSDKFIHLLVYPLPFATVGGLLVRICPWMSNGGP